MNIMIKNYIQKVKKMEKWLEQIRYSLYDTLGLFIPGGLFLMMIRYVFGLDTLDYLTKIDK